MDLTNNVAYYYLPELLRKSGEQLIWKEVKERVINQISQMYKMRQFKLSRIVRLV